MRSLWIVLACLGGAGLACTVVDPSEDGGTGAATGSTSSHEDGDSHTSVADGPPGAECQEDSDCDSFCGYCSSEGICIDDEGCCATVRQDGFGFRCSPPWDTSDGDSGPDGTTSDGSSGDASTGESSTGEASTSEGSTGEASTGEASTGEASTSMGTAP